jgi:hypothetical protein
MQAKDFVFASLVIVEHLRNTVKRVRERFVKKALSNIFFGSIRFTAAVNVIKSIAYKTPCGIVVHRDTDEAS